MALTALGFGVLVAPWPGMVGFCVAVACALVFQVKEDTCRKEMETLRAEVAASKELSEGVVAASITLEDRVVKLERAQTSSMAKALSGVGLR